MLQLDIRVTVREDGKAEFDYTVSDVIYVETAVIEALDELEFPLGNASVTLSLAGIGVVKQ